MGEIADEHYDAMMDGEECGNCGGNWSTCYCYGEHNRRSGRWKASTPPPRPETLSLFDDLDEDCTFVLAE